jgi:hypothetical protein
MLVKIDWLTESPSSQVKKSKVFSMPQVMTVGKKWAGGQGGARRTFKDD